MPRSMSWLRSTASSLGSGPIFLVRGSFQAPPRMPSTPAAADIRRTAGDPSTRTVHLIYRPFSTQKSAKNSGQTSRFRRPEAPSSAEPGARAEGSSQAELEPAIPDARPVGSTSSPRSSARPQPSTPARKPIDTSSKEYKQAASRYVRFVVAFPFLVVTSYFLYERRKSFGGPGDLARY
jgi:hypothetical protein